MVRQISHPRSSTLSLWEQGYLAGLRDAGMSINEISRETGTSKATVSKYTTSAEQEKSLPITAAVPETRGRKRKTTEEEDNAVSRS